MPFVEDTCLPDRSAIKKLHPGFDALHALSATKADSVEDFIDSLGLSNIVYIQRNVNLSLLFPFVDVLISDASSSLNEFKDFAPTKHAIETGRRNDGHIAQVVSLIDENVVFCPVSKFSATIPKIIEELTLSEGVKLTNYCQSNDNQEKASILVKRVVDDLVENLI